MKLGDYESKLNKLREERSRFLELMHSLDKRLMRGEITRYQKQFTINSITHGLQEHEYLRALEHEIQRYSESMKNEYKHSPTFKNLMVIGGSLILTVILLVLLIVPGIMKFSGENVREYTVSVNETFYAGENNYIPVNVNPEAPLTSVRINGTYKGDVKVYLVVNSTKAKYILFDSGKFDEDIVSITGNVFVIRGDPGTIGTRLSNYCDETCKLNIESGYGFFNGTTDIYLLVEVTDGSVDIESIKFTQAFANHPPEQLKNINDITIKDSTTASLDLSGYFTDADGDNIKYTLSRIPNIEGKMKGNTVIFTVPGGIDDTYSGFIYVTDERDTINSNLFRIIVNTSKIPVNKTDDTKITKYDKDKNKLPSVKTGNKLNTTTPLTGKNTTDNKSLSNNSINISTDINLTSGTGNISMDDIFMERYVRGAAFGVDRRLVNIWTNNPTATPRVIIRYSDQNNQDIESYLDNIQAGMRREKELAPQNYDVNALNDRKNALRNKIESNTVEPSKNTLTGYLVSFITGNAVADYDTLSDSEIAAIEIEIRTLDSMIATAELYDKLDKRNEFKSITYANNSNLEVLKFKLADLDIIKTDVMIRGIYLDDVVEPMITESMSLIRIPQAKLSFTTLDGSGITLCMLDTGINSAFVKNAVSGFDFVNNDSDYSDDNGHGTAVGYILYNMVPNSRLIVGKVLDADGIG
ncbi:MAG: hypothetical protein ACP5OA_03260, partial [Candidatus Woesearchaeota archaeon]